MRKAFLAIFAVVIALGLSIGNAEAARLGGGKSVGMQRQAVTPKPAAPMQQVAPTRPATPATAPAPAATPKRNWLGPIAGLAAGLGIAALLSHFGFGEGLANVVMIALLAMAALVVFRLIFRRPAKAPEEPLQYAGANLGANPGANLGDEPAYAPPQAAFPGGAGDVSGRVPADFDVDGFLRVAKLNFVRLQAANDAGDQHDLDEFLTPSLGAEIRRQMAERAGEKQQTDVVTLNAELLEVVTEGDQHIASVHFNGMVRERADAAAESFSEVWHLSKPTDGSSGWRVAGIQQVS